MLATENVYLVPHQKKYRIDTKNHGPIEHVNLRFPKSMASFFGYQFVSFPGVCSRGSLPKPPPQKKTDDKNPIRKFQRLPAISAS